MGKYIDAEKPVAGIERLLENAKNDEEKAFAKKDAAGHIAAVTKTIVCVKIKKLITSLQQEQEDADLEKEIDSFFPESYFETPINFDDVVDIARHFAEWGATHLNAKKEE